jgi:hypothetical protein
MVVRHHQPVGRQDHARPQRVLHARRGRTEVTEELVKERIARKGAGALLHDTGGIDVHHRRGGLPHQRRKAELHLRSGLGHGLCRHRRGGKGKAQGREDGPAKG